MFIEDSKFFPHQEKMTGSTVQLSSDLKTGGLKKMQPLAFPAAN